MMKKICILLALILLFGCTYGPQPKNQTNLSTGGLIITPGAAAVAPGTKTCTSGTAIQNLTGNKTGIFGDCVSVGGGGSGTPGGSDTQVQYNNGGAFAGSSNFTFNGTTVFMNNTISTTYTIGNPTAVGSGYTITYTSKVGDTCPEQGDFTNDPNNPWYIYIRALDSAPIPMGYVQSATPISLTITPDGVSGDCYNFDLAWNSVSNAELYSVVGSFFGDGLNIDGSGIDMTETTYHVDYNTGWGDSSVGADSPYTLITYPNALEVASGARINKTLTVGSTSDFYGTMVIHTSSGNVQMGQFDTGSLPAGVFLSTDGSPRLILSAGSSNIGIDMYSGYMRFIGTPMANLMNVRLSDGDFTLFSGGYGGTVNFEVGQGKIKEYADVATEGYGTPAIVDDVSLAAQTTNITTTSFTNAGTGGQYRVSYYIFTSTAGYANAGNVSVNIIWNDGTTTRTYTMPINMTLNSTTSALSYYQDSLYVRLGSGSISYNATVYGNRSASTYKFYATAERLN